MINNGIKPELLAPAGDWEKMLMAIEYGADAVYLAGEVFGLREKAGNFDIEKLAEAIKYAHDRNVLVYVTVNIFAHNKDVNQLLPYLMALGKIDVDGLIISDMGIFSMAKAIVPHIPIHVSTQANTVNWAAVNAWRDIGATRIVLGRELSLNEIKEIYDKTGAQLEVFVHGAMCMSYSGRCLLSNYLTHRDSNQGACSHPCRWKYALMEERRPGVYMPIEEDERGSYIMNSKDLCLIYRLPELIEAGVRSFKIEGRIKSAYYVATVTKVYREAIDAIYADIEIYRKNLDNWMEELRKVSHRDYFEGFLMDKPKAEDHRYLTSEYLRGYDFIGMVVDYDADKKIVTIEQRNNFKKGEIVEFLQPEGEIITTTIDEMWDNKGQQIDVAPHAQMIVKLPLEVNIMNKSILRRKCSD